MAALADYPHVLDIPTRWKDNDVYGHVNNVEYYSYFDTVINRWLITEGGLDIHAGAVIGLCVESHCAFKAALAFPDIGPRRAAGRAPGALERALRDRAVPRGRPGAGGGGLVRPRVRRPRGPAPARHSEPVRKALQRLLSGVAERGERPVDDLGQLRALGVRGPLGHGGDERAGAGGWSTRVSNRPGSPRPAASTASVERWLSTMRARSAGVVQMSCARARIVSRSCA